MNGSKVSYSSCAELKKAHTCRYSRSMERANGIGTADELMIICPFEGNTGSSKTVFPSRLLNRVFQLPPLITARAIFDTLTLVKKGGGSARVTQRDPQAHD
jgi:hypothetical protein